MPEKPIKTTDSNPAARRSTAGQPSLDASAAPPPDVCPDCRGFGLVSRRPSDEQRRHGLVSITARCQRCAPQTPDSAEADGMWRKNVHQIQKEDNDAKH